MPRQRPRQEENIKQQKKILREEERSIASFANTTRDFDRVTNRLGKVVESLQSVVSDMKKSNQSSKKEPGGTRGGGKGDNAAKRDSRARKSQYKRQQAEIARFERDADKFGFKRLQSFTNDVFGKRAAQKMTRSMAKFSGYIGGGKGGPGKGFGAGMMGRAASGLGSLAGGLMRMAGPVGAVLGVGKMIFDFWDSGGFAKMGAQFKMLTGANMKGPGGVAATREALEGTEQFREIDAKYAYIKPLEEQQARQRELYDWQTGTEREMLGFRQSLIKDEIGFQMDLQRDAINFANQQAMETLDAEMDKRKAIAASGMKFISNYSKVSERALRAIGSSTKAIIEGISKFQSIMGLGVKGSFQLSENAQGLAYHFGAGAEDVMNMTNLFRLMGKTSAKTAQSLIGGITKFAEINDLAPQAIFAQIKDAGEDIYKFSSGTAENFVKQASLLTKMSVSMSQMMKASDTMVLNYKDSIKAEMSLSAMLGKNVNLSEVRARLMQGDQAGAASALKTALGGTDINAMNAFQKQALTQATGMDISALMGLQQGKGAGGLKGGLSEQENAGKKFADGALKQDIANAGAKLALEQAQRKKLLEFEQKQRLANLLVEQTMRLESIQLEAEQRAYWTFKFEQDFEKNQIAAQTNAEAAKNVFVAKQQRQILESELRGMGIGLSGPGGTQITQTLSNIQRLQEAGRLSADASAQFQQSLAAEIMKVKDVKDEKQIAAAMATAMNSSIGPQMQKYQSDVKTAIERQVNIAKASMGSGKDFEAYKKKYNVTDEEAKSARKLVKTETKYEYYGGMGGGAMVTRDTGLNQAAIDELIKANSFDTQTKVQATTGKPMVDELKTQSATIQSGNNKTLAAQTKIATQQVKELNETEYQSLTQQKMIQLLGVAAQFLGQISANTAKDASININGKVISRTLLEQAKQNYGFGKVLPV